MRKKGYVPMITLCLLLAGCGSTEKVESAELRGLYQEMDGCTMSAVVSCDQNGTLWETELQCEYLPGGESTVEVLAPETIAGIKAVIRDADWSLEYEGDSLNVGHLSSEDISPATCLPRLMDALRGGWLLEENRETWNDTACVRVTVDQTGAEGGKILSTVWLHQEDGTPLRGEIAVNEEIILTAEFTSFSFYDKITNQN